MMIIGLTGGIGSGKTTVAGFFKDLGIAVYIADDAGKRLMNESPVIREKVQELLGEEAYKNGAPDRKFIASKVFQNKQLLEQLNSIIHPAVEADFKIWRAEQTSAYIIYEAAILFETGSNKKCDLNILVTAPKKQRIQRLLKRDDSNLTEIEARMKNQWSDARKSKLADFTIDNTKLEQTKLQVAAVHDKILKAGKNSEKFC
ncbi:dephospho-CoA kinase [Christiangramia aquimixticola]|uniref:dephospho-CoA kinase n=1 Tax=Christiangramia aquimixticola TaxID=1697558 RepID=UPI003AA8330C